MGGGCTSSDGPSLSLSVKQVTSKILDGGGARLEDKDRRV